MSASMSITSSLALVVLHFSAADTGVPRFLDTVQGDVCDTETEAWDASNSLLQTGQRRTPPSRHVHEQNAHHSLLQSSGLHSTSSDLANEELASYRCGLWRAHEQIWDTLPGGNGFKRRHGGDIVAALPDAAECERVLTSFEKESPLAFVEGMASFTPPQQNLDASSDRLPVIPYPAEVSFNGSAASDFPLSQATMLVLGMGVPESDMSVKVLRGHLAALSRKVPEDSERKTEIHLELDPTAGHQNDEGYTLTVKHDVVELRAPSLAGLFYGAQTLTQLTPQSGKPDLAALEIQDSPRFKWRGIHLDVSRHFFRASDVKKMLETMASLKLNRFHWHLTDDQGWRLPVKGYPKLTDIGAMGVSSGAYTADEIKDVVAYAHARHIKVLPEVDIPGHAAAAIAAYPELGNSDVAGWRAPHQPMTEWGTHKFTMAPSSATMKFLDTVFDQVAELFPDAIVHIGGDEVSKKEWQQSKLARSLLQKEKLTNVQAYFNSLCATLLHKQNRSMVAWDEAPAVGGMPADAIVMAWRSTAEVVKAARGGRRVINADQGSLYFDHYQGPERSEPRAFGGFSPLDKVYGYDPMPEGLSKEQQKLVIGGQAELWSEYIATWEHLEYMAFPRSHALAERLWTPPAGISTFGDFKGRLKVRLQDLDHRGVNYRKL